MRWFIIAPIMLGAAVLAAPSLVLAADPIDTAKQRCFDTTSTPDGMQQCVAAAADTWDKALNTAYEAAMAKRDDAGRKRLREAQRAWLAYRDADTAFRSGDFVFGRDGQDRKLMLDEAGLDVIRARTLVLRQYADTRE